jgi:hypothetical protein
LNRFLLHFKKLEELFMQAMYDRVIPPVLRGFEAMRVYVEMAEIFAGSSGVDPGELVQATPASGMSSLARHVQKACDTAISGVARLTGDCLPGFEDNEKTLDELKTRIDKTIAYLLTVDMKSFPDGETCSIERQPRDTCGAYTNDHCASSMLVKEIYFHILAGRQILQDCGVRIDGLHEPCAPSAPEGCHPLRRGPFTGLARTALQCPDPAYLESQSAQFSRFE